MKIIARLFIFVAFAFCLPAASHAAVGQCKNLSTAGSSVICIPGATDQLIIIQNNGSNSVRLSLDGGVAYIDPITGKAGTNPTPTTGYLLPAGQQLVIATVPYSSVASSGLHKPIVAIMVTSTTTIDIITDGTQTQFPTT